MVSEQRPHEETAPCTTKYRPPDGSIEINGEAVRRHLAAYLLIAVAPSVLDRTLSSGDIAATQLADAARQLVGCITGAAQKR